MSLPNNSAFPFVFVDPQKNVQHVHTGLTVREHFAAMAMQGLLAADGRNGETWEREHLVIAAVMYADALLAALTKP